MYLNMTEQPFSKYFVGVNWCSCCDIGVRKLHDSGFNSMIARKASLASHPPQH